MLCILILFVYLFPPLEDKYHEGGDFVVFTAVVSGPRTASSIHLMSGGKAGKGAGREKGKKGWTEAGRDGCIDYPGDSSLSHLTLSRSPWVRLYNPQLLTNRTERVEMTPPKSFSQWVLEPGNDTWLPYDDILSNVLPTSYKIKQECAILGLVFCYLCYTFVFEEEIGILSPVGYCGPFGKP